MRSSSPTEMTVHDPDTLEIAYQKWIKKEMDKRLLDYSDIKRVVIKCANWNVSAHSLEEASLSDLRKWLLPMESAGIGEAPDIYAVGLQEVIDLNVRNTFFNNTARTEVTAKCVHILSQVLNELEYYKVLLDKTMVGIILVIFVKSDIYEHIQEVGYSLTFNGALGMAGNKGGIAVRMLLYDSPICFVCAHLAANRESTASRNIDYKAIIENSDFTVVTPVLSLAGDNDDDEEEISYKDIRASAQTDALAAEQRKNARANHTTNTTTTTTSDAASDGSNATKRKSTSGGRPKSIFRHRYSKAGLLPTTGAGVPMNIRVLSHDYVFFLGDLNYRIDECIDSHIVHEVFTDQTTSADKFRWLLEFDQLTMELVKGEVFHDFQEGNITFRPTYKYVAGTHNYDVKRVPAWCDRVLWWTNEALRRQLLPPAEKRREEEEEASPPSEHKEHLLQLSSSDEYDHSHHHTDIKSTNIGVNLFYYKSTDSIVLSDHKPIGALFECSVVQVRKEQLVAVYQELLVTVDRWINNSVPKATVIGRLMEFAPFFHEIPQTVQMTIHNTGTVMTQWILVPKFEDTVICKPWISIYPLQGILAPDEKMEILVTVHLTLKDACKIAMDDNNVVEDIFILRLVNGNDYFCIVNGSLAAECSDYLRRNFSHPSSSSSTDRDSVVTFDKLYG